jgi:peptidoglycan/LPS O-acetylase OafA/YrhL
LQTIPAHNNNFDFLRFLFASLVIFSHSYALLTGDIRNDPFYHLTGRVLSEIGVCGFFSISGYLIHQSLQRSSSLFSFVRKRLFRIFPGLIVAILFTTLILGTWLSNLQPARYLGDPQTWVYAVKNIFLIPGTQTLPGVFNQNPENAVNGSLWTLRYELLLYALLSVLFFISLRKKKLVIPTVLVVLLAGIFLLRYNVIPVPAAANKLLYYVSVLGSYFFGGALLSLFTDFLKKHKGALLLISAAIFIISLFFFVRTLEVARILSFVLMVITFGLHYAPILNFSRYTGDVSYGTYIYAYPLQQALIAWLQPEAVWTLMLPSFVLSWLAGLLSWHLVEKKFIRRKAK